MWFCVMTFLSWHKEPLSWIYCFVELWPQGFVREMNCSQGLEILRQFTVEPWSGWSQQQISVFLFGTNPLDCWNMNFLWEHMDQVWCGLNFWPEASRRGYSSSQNDGEAIPASFGMGLEQAHTRIPSTLNSPCPLLWQSHSAVFLLPCCSWCSHIYPASSTRQETLKWSLFWKRFL